MRDSQTQQGVRSNSYFKWPADVSVRWTSILDRTSFQTDTRDCIGPATIVESTDDSDQDRPVYKKIARWRTWTIILAAGKDLLGDYLTYRVPEASDQERAWMPQLGNP